MAVAIVLDPTEVATGRTQLDISNWAAAEVDWGDAAIEAYAAEAALGQVPVDFRVPNRIVTIPLRLRTVGATTFGTIRTQVQAKSALMQRQGGWVKRTSALGDVFADVVSATLRLGGSGMMENVRQADADATLTLECLPEWYQAEVDLGTTTESTAAELRKVMATVKGNYAGRGRVVVNELQGQNQEGVLWGLRSANYSSASTAALAYEADALSPLDAASVVGLAGASGGNAMRHNSLLPASWTPVLSTTILSGSADLTHQGSYRVWARVYTTTTTLPRVRFVWDVGDLTFPVENTAADIPAALNFYGVDLGEVRLDAPPVGTFRWRGMVQAYDSAGGGNVYVDKLWLVPIDDGYGVLRASSGSTNSVTTYVARDGFDQTAGALTGKTLPVGGTWVGAGDTDDFSVSGSSTITRAAVSDAANTGRYVTASTPTLAACLITLTYTDPGSNPTLPVAGIIARYVDVNNWAMARIENASSNYRIRMYKRVAGTITQIGDQIMDGTKSWPMFITLRIDDAGNFSASVTWAGNPTWTTVGQDSVLATGGALASGKVGIYDAQTSATANTRIYDNFLASAYTQDAVVYGNQSAELRYDGMFREDGTGTAYGPVSRVIGDLPRLPPSGLEGRSVELFVKASRGDFDQLPDTGIDDLSVQVLYRPSWLFLPEA